MRLPGGRRDLQAALLLVLATVGGWIGAKEVFLPLHFESKTGRSELPDIMCPHCHVRPGPPPSRGAADGPRYLSPAGLAVSADGTRLFVTAEDADRLLEVDLASGRIARSIELPGRPHGVALSADGRRLAVSARDGDTVLVLDSRTLEVLHSTSGSEPLGVALSPAGERVYVANGFTDDLLVEPLGAAEGSVHLAAGNEPYALALSGDGALLAVANRRVDPVPPRVMAASEITLVDARHARVAERRELVSAHLSEGIALTRDGSLALAGIVRFRNLLPLTQVARGAVMNSALAFVETRPGGRTVQFPLDEVNAYFADPAEVVLSADERRAFVAHAGARVVSVVDVDALRAIVRERDEEALEALADDLGISTRYVLARIPTDHLPRALALAPDGRRLYVAEQLADSVAVIDTERLEVVDRIDLGGPRELTEVRRGERVFHDASITFQGQFSCRSCHPDGHTDGLIWDFEIDGPGKHLLETRSLWGIRDTAPFKWSGKNPDLATQCGPRFARVLTRSDPFPPERLAELVAYIESLGFPPRRVPDELVEARERGRRIFFRTATRAGDPIPVAARCNTCHRPPLFTDRLPTDVGTGGHFDTPHLLDVGATPPYLHDGRALTLEEIWTVYSPDDSHGTTADLTKLELNDLVVFLRSL
jgi:YVTN family beta-propeller protein